MELASRLSPQEPALCTDCKVTISALEALHEALYKSTTTTITTTTDVPLRNSSHETRRTH